MGDSLIGTVLDDKYLVDEFLGAGGYGQVYRVTRQADGKALALKLLKDCDEQSERELKAMFELDHPNLVEYFDSGTLPGGESYLVMELADGTLAGRLGEGLLTPEEAWELVEAVGSGLASLHAQKHIHRDLKPQNILRCQGRWKLADLGLSRQFNSRVTRASRLGGTFTFIAPESFSGQTGPGVDIWALGVLLHDALTGKLPFPEGVEQRMRAIISGQVEISSDLPQAFVPLVRACLQTDPEQRLTARELLAGLTDSGFQPVVQEQEVAPELTPEPSAASSSPTSSTERPKKSLAPVLLVAVAGALFFSLYWFGSSGPTTEETPDLTLPATPVATATTVALKVVVSPPDATLLLDGEPFPGEASDGEYEAHLKPGNYRVEARNASGSLQEVVGLSPETGPVALPLVLPSPTPTPSRSPTIARGAPTDVQLEVTSRPLGAVLTIDGNQRHLLPFRGVLKAGEHTMRVEKSGYVSVERRVELRGPRQNISFTLDEHRPLPRATTVRPPASDPGYAEDDYPRYRPQPVHRPRPVYRPRPAPQPRPTRTWRVGPGPGSDGGGREN